MEIAIKQLPDGGHHTPSYRRQLGPVSRKHFSPWLSPCPVLGGHLAQTCPLPLKPVLGPLHRSRLFALGQGHSIIQYVATNARRCPGCSCAVLKSSQLLPGLAVSQAKTLAPPLSITSISSGDKTERRKRAGNSSRSKNMPLAGSIDPSAAAGAAPMPSSLRRVHVFWRGPYCWDRWRYSEKEWEGRPVKFAGRELVGLAG